MTIRIKLPNVTFTIERLKAPDATHEWGLKAIPCVTLKTKLRASVVWWGIFIVESKVGRWEPSDYDQLKRRLLSVVNTFPEGTTLGGDVDRIARNIVDYINGNRRSAFYGADHHNVFLSMQLGRGITLDVSYLDKPDDNTNYGGYKGMISIKGTGYPFNVYHRGITLYDYISELELTELIRSECVKQFPVLFDTVHATINARIEKVY